MTIPTIQGLQRGDLIVKFGHLNKQSFSSSSLQPLADLVAESENVRPTSMYTLIFFLTGRQRHIAIRALRGEQTKLLTLTPRNGWGGRGMLG
jgi:26S proteasome non-ATPase regulatory subunit 9